MHTRRTKAEREPSPASDHSGSSDVSSSVQPVNHSELIKELRERFRPPTGKLERLSLFINTLLFKGAIWVRLRGAGKQVSGQWGWLAENSRASVPV